MYPEVPIALRMSGHLLLGVVRIYSKKVDYLYQDYNFFLITFTKAFASVEVNLPDDATHAPFHSVTLPDTFELDALSLDEDLYYEGLEDNHLRSQEDITLTEQIPIAWDPYITITLDKDSLSLEDTSDPLAMPMEDVDVQDPGPTNQMVANEKTNEDSFSNKTPEIEKMRDAVHNFQNIPPLQDPASEPDATLERQSVNDKELTTPAAEEILISGGRSSSPAHLGEPVNSAPSNLAADISDLHVLDHDSPNLVIRRTPPDEQQLVEQPRGRKRRRKLLFDESTVLTNKFVKAGLDDCNDLRRKKKHCPSSALDVWKSNNRLRKENIFLEPLMLGLCADVCNIYKRDFISAKPHPVSVEEQRDQMPSSNMEIERPRNIAVPVDNNVVTENNVGTPNTFIHSQRESSPVSFVSEPHLRTTPGTDRHSSPNTFIRYMDTPSPIFPEPNRLPDIPEDLIDDLNFLAIGEYTPTEVQGTQGVGTLSGTTRKVAQYLKEKSSVTPSSQDLSGDLVLNELLEGKSRKVSARMFSETLVLKCYGLVDVQQEEPYGDIALKLTPKLLKDLD
ncbi:hypothetical protein Vadar_029735 [Vaccinium darrowii]|uniref:Uncharacterized protein n=1 Tax=Vaccinium darrowii TaxID=229202 RepID=A0ACB7ZFB3_9ERIC|nr:hypothetical protein Vadar_029735 [Vaccinium darrowii]